MRHSRPVLSVWIQELGGRRSYILEKVSTVDPIRNGATYILAAGQQSLSFCQYSVDQENGVIQPVQYVSGAPKMEVISSTHRLNMSIAPG
jgi:hypothetical protein